MKGSKLLVAIALCLTAALAQAAGLRSIDVPDGPALKGAMWYPCPEPPGEIVLGGRSVPGVKDCPISGEKLPLVVVSHGNGGSFVNFPDTAETLADVGFIVVTVNHPGDNSVDASRVADLSVFVERPIASGASLISCSTHRPPRPRSIRNTSASLAFRRAAIPVSS